MYKGRYTKLGFLAGAVLATWLSLTYPTQMRAVFEQLVTIVQQITQPSSESHSDMVTPEQSYP
ncbi:TPA: hypothetical protein I4G32_08415 [Enterobacter hormaechei subsp. oharae]|nr:hypothetical protein [Enterobacter hormaechei subsp. oharae]HAS1749887.1 hypothetical protein [Enterobacter hormaechei subsp. oharae]